MRSFNSRSPKRPTGPGPSSTSGRPPANTSKAYEAPISYVFMFLYTIAIALGCRFISACTGNEILIKGGRGFAWLIVGATICDFIENIALSHTIRGPISQLNVTIAYNLARVKFSIVMVCILFMLTCALFWVIGRLEKVKK